MRRPNDDESIVVVEQDSGIRAMDDDTIEAAAVEMQSRTGTTGEFGSLEDTFSSETAVNLDQQDPLAEADFHMAYGLYDQAADLINGALEVEPRAPGRCSRSSARSTSSGATVTLSSMRQNALTGGGRR